MMTIIRRRTGSEGEDKYEGPGIRQVLRCCHNRRNIGSRYRDILQMLWIVQATRIHTHIHRYDNCRNTVRWASVRQLYRQVYFFSYRMSANAGKDRTLHKDFIRKHMCHWAYRNRSLSSSILWRPAVLPDIIVRSVYIRLCFCSDRKKAARNGHRQR